MNINRSYCGFSAAFIFFVKEKYNMYGCSFAVWQNPYQTVRFLILIFPASFFDLFILMC